MSNINVDNLTPLGGTSGKIGLSGSLLVTHITASGNISSSGTVYANTFHSTGGDSAGINFTDDVVVTGHITASGNISGSGNISASGNFYAGGNTNLGGTLSVAAAATGTVGFQNSAVARTATDDGSGTGTIAAGTAVVSVNADSDANHIIILPAPVVGNIIHLIETGTTGYELRTSTPASIGINGGTATNGESAIAGAITYVKCVCVSSTNWICSQFDADGDESKVEAAA
jgi:hypothetical protein